jgi:hypothetical protein
MHTNFVAHVQFLCKHFRNSLDFEIVIVVHTMHNNHHSRCNVLIFEFRCHTHFDAMKYIHPLLRAKCIVVIKPYKHKE